MHEGWLCETKNANIFCHLVSFSCKQNNFASNLTFFFINVFFSFCFFVCLCLSCCFLIVFLLLFSFFCLIYSFFFCVSLFFSCNLFSYFLCLFFFFSLVPFFLSLFFFCVFFMQACYHAYVNIIKSIGHLNFESIVNIIIVSCDVDVVGLDIHIISLLYKTRQLKIIKFVTKYKYLEIIITQKINTNLKLKLWHY